MIQLTNHSHILKILYFSRDYTPHDHRFLSALAGTGHTVGYLRLENKGHNQESRPLPPQIRVLDWAGGRRPARLSDGYRLLGDLKRIITSFQPDVIQAGPLQTAAFLAALTGFKRLVSASWGYDLLFDARRSLLWTWATRYTLKRSAAFIGDCDTIRNLAVFYGMQPERIITFPWGVDIRQFQPGSDGGLRERLGWDSSHFVLLSTRSWAPLYGVEDLAQAFVQAAAQLPELRLLMLGSGPQAELLNSIFRQHDLLERVRFPGQVAQADLPDYYRAADLYISTSHSDGTSISLLEALASGVPVLLSDIPGNREWVEPGTTGWLYPDGKVKALQEAILQAVSWRTHLSQMGLAARQLAESRADWEKNFPRLLDAYAIALNHRN